MNWPEDTYLKSVATWLPEPTPVADAVRRGEIESERADELAYASICVADDVAPPDMAVRAARSALTRAGLAGRDVGLLLYGSSWYQGIDMWPAASYLADAIGSAGTALDVQQRCNGGLVGLELAAAALHQGLVRGDALVTTADRFALPGCDRWHMHERTLYGDGATAAVVGRDGGFARIVSSSTHADHSLERLSRGDEPFDVVSRAHKEPVDFVRRYAEFYRDHDPSRIQMRLVRAISASVRDATKAAGTKAGDMRRVITAAIGRFGGGDSLHSLLGVADEAMLWDFGRVTGHIGGGDWFAGLEHLVRTRALDPGDRVLLIGGGAGYTCTSVVIEILDVPDLATDPTDEVETGG